MQDDIFLSPPTTLSSACAHVEMKVLTVQHTFNEMDKYKKKLPMTNNYTAVIKGTKRYYISPIEIGLL